MASDSCRILLPGFAAVPNLPCTHDLHWADEATLDLLDFIATRIEHAPLVLLGTYRDAELEFESGAYSHAR